MSEVKPVYQGSRNPSLGWKEITKEEFDEVSESIQKGFTGLFVQVLYPASVVEALQAENAKLKEEVKVGEKLIAEHQRLLDSIPECEAHGKCVPHAIEWVTKAKDQAKALDEIKSFLQACADGSMSRNNMENLAAELLDSILALERTK